MGGVLTGVLGTIYGWLCIGYSDDAAVRTMGIMCTAAGAGSLYFGLRNTIASNRKYDEKHGMVIDPVLIDDGTGRLGPGVQVSWKF